jgi:hypothetical protein
VIITYADPPYDLTETVAARAADSITLSWTDGASDGGAAIIDYRITIDGVTFDDGILTNSYTA